MVRHRGCPPRSTEYLLGKPHARSEAACFIGLCKLMGVDADAYTGNRIDLANSARLCEVFATYRALMPDARLAFEQLLLVLATTARRAVLKTGNCPHCGALVVVDPLDLAEPICFHCDTAVGLYAPNPEVRALRAAEPCGAYRSNAPSRGGEGAG